MSYLAPKVIQSTTTELLNLTSLTDLSVSSSGQFIKKTATSTFTNASALDDLLGAGDYALTFGTNINVDWNNGAQQYVSLTGNTTFTFSNPTNGQVYRLRLIRGSEGNFSIVWPSVRWRMGSVPTFTTVINRADWVTLIYSNGEYYADASFNF